MLTFTYTLIHISILSSGHNVYRAHPSKLHTRSSIQLNGIRPNEVGKRWKSASTQTAYVQPSTLYCVLTNVNVDSVFVHSVRFAIPIHFNRIRVWARSGKSYMLYWAVCCLFRYDWFSIRFIIIHSILLFLILYFVFRFKVFFISLLLLLESCSLVLSFVCSFVRSFVSYSWVKTSYTHMLHGSSYVKRKYTTAYAQFVFRMLVITDNTENADNTTDLLYNKCCAV